MKRLLVLCAAAALFGAAPANYNAFGVAALQKLAAHSGNSNVFISPVSLGVALAMTADGAAGSTRTQMLDALRVSGTNLAQANAALIASLTSNHDAQIGIADALWLRSDPPPRPQYVSLLQKDYDATAQALHFGDPSAAAAINAWAKTHTLGLIDELVTQTYRTDYAYLTNALAFKASWTTPFAHSATSPQPFTDASGKRSNVQMMSRTGFYETADEGSYRALRLPYGKGGYAAYVLLPNGNSTSVLTSGLTASTFDHLAHAVQGEELHVEMPRFTATFGSEMVPLLESMGVRLPFGDGADFSPMCGCRTGTLYIASVIHKTYVGVNEAGTTAAAATSVEIVALAVRPTKTAQFIVNHPFVFAIRDEYSGALLFLGVINEVTP